MCDPRSSPHFRVLPHRSRNPLVHQRMSAQLGQDTRVVGWYHSHPHITVLPSHVGKRRIIRWFRNFW
ncbi:unnamed protein product [Scytosiphon promiscuus]